MTCCVLHYLQLSGLLSGLIAVISLPALFKKWGGQGWCWCYADDAGPHCLCLLIVLSSIWSIVHLAVWVVLTSLIPSCYKQEAVRMSVFTLWFRDCTTPLSQSDWNSGRAGQLYSDQFVHVGHGVVIPDYSQSLYVYIYPAWESRKFSL